MIGGMDWMTTIPLIVGVIGKLSAFALQALVERLLTLALAVLIIGGASILALTGLAWLRFKHAIGEVYARPGTAPS